MLGPTENFTHTVPGDPGRTAVGRTIGSCFSVRKTAPGDEGIREGHPAQ